MGFVQTNYHIIMREIDRIMSEKGVSTQELVLELELYKDLGQESSLANQDKFKVGVTQEYLEGNRPKNQKFNVNAFVSGLSRIHGRMTSRDLLALARHGDGSSDYYCVQIKRPIDFPDECVKTLRERESDTLEDYFVPEPMIPFQIGITSATSKAHILYSESDTECSTITTSQVSMDWFKGLFIFS